MGLDNYPKPYPCESLEKADKLKIVRDEYGDPECEATDCPFKLLPTGCWIRGKVFNEYVHECCGELVTLYEEKTREELVNILQSLKEHSKRNYPEEKIPDADAYAHLRQLIEYLEILLSIKEWKGKLVAWF